MARADDCVQPPLGRYEERFWTRDYEIPVSAQRVGTYRVFVPDSIAQRPFPIASETQRALAQAQSGLAQLQDTRSEVSSLAALARNLLRSESAASSRIEGIQISQRNLARAAYTQRTRGRGGDNRAAEVLGNVEAMERAIELGARAQPLTLEDIQDVHRTLLRFTVDRDIAGIVRTRQNWIGGNDYHPLGAVYVGPPPELVPDLLADFCAFCGRDDLHPIAQAAILHAQFENIHPFMDGNGRTGRALIYALLRHRAVIPHYVPPISLALGAQPKDYVAGLGSFSAGGYDRWCMLFADAVALACTQAERLAASTAALQATWLRALGQPRSDAAVRQIIGELPAQPLIDVAAAQQLTSKSHVAVGRALAQLTNVGAIMPLNERKWGRVWECRPLLDLVEDVERRISTP